MTSNVKSKNISLFWGNFCLSLTERNVDIRINTYEQPKKMVMEKAKEIDLIPPNVLKSIIAPADDFLSPQLLSSIVTETAQDRKFKEVLQEYDQLRNRNIN